VELSEGFHEIEVGKAEVLSEGGDVALLAVGTMVDAARKTAALLAEKGVRASVVNMRFVKPLDTDVIDRFSDEARLLVTLEENALAGGFGAAVTEYLADAGIKTPVLRIGIPDRFVPQGARKKLLESCGLLPEQIADKIMEKWTGLS
ncbi:MAG: 1-deoxy-D-xylulose-5-phosphate synthase, partial [Schwartzia sp.]|nr:1-deoxy-D-xylulose-5-phosphate synthase [Schwartzia sp. (in: firmicutes)]